LIFDWRLRMADWGLEKDGIRSAERKGTNGRILD
jgi:hypothetical protein